MSATIDQRVKNLEGRFRHGLIIVVTVVLVSAVGLALTVSVVRRMDARDARDDREAAQRDALAAGQRAHLLALAEVQHSCLLPARPDQHDPEPVPHVHECWDAALGALLKGQQEQLDAVLRSAKSTETVVNFLNSPERAKALADALAQIRRSTEEAQAAVLSRTTLEVRDPARPDAPPLQVKPIVSPSPGCQSAIGAGPINVELCPPPAP